MTQESIRQVAELLLMSEHTLVLTGAGVSTASGIPDFRSPQNGLWNNINPMSLMSMQAFRRDPEGFYEAFRQLFSTWVQAEPNPAHLALAELERLGLVKGIITQNVDDLHQKAGSQRVWEIHGNLRHGTCLHCETTCALQSAVSVFIETGEVPRCPECGIVLKPNIILYGEMLPRFVFMDVMGELERCELIVVVGSSLATVPAADLPFWAAEQGAHVVVINGSPTPADEMATVLVRDRVEVVLPQIAELCRRYLAGETDILMMPRDEDDGARSRWSFMPDLARIPFLSLPRMPQVMPAVRRYVPTLDSLRTALWDHGADHTERLDELLMAMQARRAMLGELQQRVTGAPSEALRRAQDAARRSVWRLSANWLSVVVHDHHLTDGTPPDDHPLDG